MKFSTIAKGTRAEKPLLVPGYDAFTVLFRPLTGLEEVEVLERARVGAVARGIIDPKPGEEMYDRLVMAQTIAIGCVDPDSSADARTPSFDGGPEQILAEVHAETIAFLFEAHEQWQSECSPYVRKMQEGVLLDKVLEVAGPDGTAAFIRMSPAMRVIFTRSLASMLLRSQDLKSLFTAVFADMPTNSPPSQEQPTTLDVSK